LAGRGSCRVMAVACLWFVTPAAAEDQKFDFNISDNTLGAALASLSQQAHVGLLYPYQLAPMRGVHSVSGRYTVPEALEVMLHGTGFSGGVTAQGTITVSLRNSRCNSEGKEMIQDSKSTVSLLALLAGLSSAPACAQTPTTSSTPADSVETITVTGYRASLQSAAVAKRGAANFSDSVYAEDIGKFPDLNIAEALNRIPGVRLSRDQSGEGTQIVVRGLGPSFTQVLMNGHPVAVATDGTTNSGNQNREVDLDMFPVELFTKINVNKTPTADMFEGGIAGAVDLGTAKPLDNSEAGLHLNYSLQGEYSDTGSALSPRGAVIGSYNWNNKLGVLVGIAAQHYKFRVDGYETVGNALADLTTQNPSCTACNTIGTGKNFRWATTVPVGVAADASLGIGAAGTSYAYSGGATAGGTSGLSTADLSNVIFPYLGGGVSRDGARDRVSILTDVQYRPTEDLEFNINVLFEHSQRNFDVYNLQWFVRNSCNAAGTASNCMVPVNVETDSQHYLTSGTFLNSAFIGIDSSYRENVQFLDVNPTVDWTPVPWLKIRGSVDYNDSSMNRRNWAFLLQTGAGSGYAVTYNMKPGSDMPTYTTSVPLNDASNGTWQWYQVRTQPLYRNTLNRGTAWDLMIGDETNNFKFGYAYNENYRFISARDNGTMAQRCVMGTSAVGSLCTMPDGTTLTPGADPLVSNSQLQGYLTGIPVGDYLQLSDGSYNISNWSHLNSSLVDATHIKDFMNTAPFTPTGAIGAQKSGGFDEKNQNGYVEANAVAKIMDRDVHFNGGLRYYNTTQRITGPVSMNGVYVDVSTTHTYQGVLPSFNISADVIDNLVFRVAGSRTMTRAQPAAMLPGIAFNSALLSPVTAGNPNLQPYFSDNMDLGLEWYTGGPGLVAIDYFRKEISNFTVSQTITEPFSATGIPLAALTPTQLADYNANGGPNETVQVTTTVNLQQKLHLEGWEVQYVQPLDFVLEGTGFTATYTRLTQYVDSGLTVAQASGLATGIAPYTLNVGAYYEKDGASLHVTYNYVAKFVSGATPFSQGIMQPEYTEAHGQVDLSASYTLPWFDGTLLEGSQISLDGLNLTGVHIRTYIGSPNNPENVYYPGTSFIIGFRGKL
jgi:TonB-dependent receptor